MSSSLSLTPSVVTDRPVTPNDFLMSSACRGSASHVMPSAVHSTSLPSTRTLCTQSWYPERSKNSSIRHHPELLQCHEEPSDIDDVIERNEIVSMYPYTELLLQMSVDARRRSALHKSNLDHNLANCEFPIHTSVSTAVHTPEQASNFALTSIGFCREFHEHFVSEQRCRSVLGARLSASGQRALSTQLAVLFRCEARELLHKSTNYAVPRAEEWL